jgi:hypothetical protein
MIRDRTLEARERLLDKLPVTGELLRGSLLERTVQHTRDCPKCARGEGHRVFVLTVTFRWADAANQRAARAGRGGSPLAW